MTRLLFSALRVMLAAWLSMAAIAVHAHEIEPTVADVTVTEGQVTVQLRTALEPLIAGIDLAEVDDTDFAPQAQDNDALRRASPSDLEAAFRDAWPRIQGMIRLEASEPLTPRIQSVAIPPVGDPELRRDSRLTLVADLPDDGSPVTLALAPQMGTLVVRQIATEGDAYEAFLTDGAATEPMPRTGVVQQSVGEVTWRYLLSGFDHIIPKGLDHILFVLGLLFYALSWRPLLWQVTAFTAAHTVTLALATTGVVNIPDNAMWIVETIIAASITYVAVENLLVIRRSRLMPAAMARGGQADEALVEMPQIGWDRIGIVFAFGLLHGLGFASVLSEFGLGQHFVVSLIAFNVGVELGQLAVIALAISAIFVAFQVIGRRLTPAAEGYHAIAVVGSLLIAAQGAWWVIERAILG